MALVTDYASLQTEVANVLNRADLAADIPMLIQMAERRFLRDNRARKLQDRATFNITADGDSLPSDFDSLDSWYHDGPSFYGSLEVVEPGEIARYNSQFGPTGVPRVVAVVEGKARYGPAPSGTFSTRMTYWRRLEPLSVAAPSNWLLADHPDVYLWGTLAEAEAFLQNDERVALWEAKADRALTELDAETQRKRFSGQMVRRRRAAIGG